MIYNPIEQKSYIIPSENFNEVEVNTVTQSNVVLTGQALVDEFQDDKLNCSVNRLENYDIGDTIYVKDVISDLVYNPDDDITVMYFGNTEVGSFEWPFAGDLRERFTVGDDIAFRFKVVEEYSADEYTFESLDYFMESYDLMEKGTAADINDYIME